MSDEEESSGDGPSLEQQVMFMQKRHRGQSIVSWFILLFSIIFLVTTVISVVSLFQPLPKLSKKNPEYKFKLLKLSVNQAEENLQQDFATYSEFSQSEDVMRALADSKKFALSPIAEEEDLISLIENYRSAMFNIASNVRGSGESHHFYRSRLRNHIEQIRFRIEKLKQLEQQ